jgi:osmotically-inducible protein OsmY/uncharacterized protein YrrD
MSEFDFNIGAQVRCEDGRCGQLLKVVVDPAAQEITDLVIEKGFLLKDSRVLPIETVEETTEDEIRLSIASDQLGHFEAYEKKAFEIAAPGWKQRGTYKKGEAVRWTTMATPYGAVTSRHIVPMVRQRVHKGISAKETVLEQGTSVKNAQGEVGAVDHVLVDPDSGDIEHVVVDRGLLARSLIIPASDVKEVAEDAVLVDLGDDDLNELPRYRPPGEASILAELQDQLEAAPSDFRDVEAVLDGGILQLSGTVPTIASKRRAEAAARSIDGVVDVENTLSTDTAIASRVTIALADDSRTELADIDVASDRGIITLVGQVDSAEIREAAEEVAESQSGVVEVINDLEVGPDEDTEALDVRSGGIAFGHQA